MTITLEQAIDVAAKNIHRVIPVLFWALARRAPRTYGRWPLGAAPGSTLAKPPSGF